MKRRFHNLPIQQKMLVMTLLICGAVLLVAIVALFTFQVLNFRSSFQRDATTLATIIANNSAGAVAFKFDADAAEMVGSLKVKPEVISASLVLPDGSVLANFGAKESASSLGHFPAPGDKRFVGGDLLVTQPVMQKGEHEGTLFLRMDYQRTFLALLQFYGLVILGIVMVSIGLGVFLSRRLGRAITQPVLQLARTARIVGKKKDYSVRAVVDGRGDELGSLAESFNDMLGRIQSQDAALSFSQQKLQALVDSIDGIVWERKPDTFQFTFISRQSESILGYAPEAWLDKPDFWENKLHPQDAAKAVQTAHEVATRGQPYSFEYRMLAADERTVWIRESGTVLTDQGQPVAMRGIFQDVTQAKLDALQLDKLNRQLIDASRSAGMADVATGVLHNVGNVLNSVSVSATVVADRLRRSKVSKLCRATAMLRERNGHLAEFLTTDPKGKLIPEYLTTVADEIAAEQSELITRMSTVGEHIEHIKEIVAMQQSYARVSGVYETLPATDLVEDALRINATAFDRHGIELVREFDKDSPTVCVDRHKVLQILINLLRNAKHALDEQDPEHKRLIVRVAPAAPAMCRITILDNGVGIPAENLTRIFNHGFTTKKNGHGFGLHSGSNAAKEMGGRLSGHSEGPGKGAEFILELPTTPRQGKAESTTRT
ncbi:MAG TPA: PAS domain-containing protein [Verrucomicrobiae bacterium]|nr:PAS domain-containing protein [Verrucomicrobiae bacterium]